eukprot:s676_g8.t1
MTRGFADLVYQEALLCNGKCKLLRSRVSYILTQRGCTLTSLLPTDVRHWWPLIEDVFNSPQIRQLHHDVTSFLCSRDEYKYISIDATIKCCVIEDVFNSPQIRQLHHDVTSFLCSRDEYKYISIDATIKCCVSILGQASWRSNVVTRNEAPFDDVSAVRRVLTVRGRTGAVLGMFAIASEKAEEVAMALGSNLPLEGLRQVRMAAADNASRKLYLHLRRIMPGLESLCLDPIHLAITYERPAFTVWYATWRKKTPGAVFLRKVLKKLIVVDATKSEGSWGGYFRGYEERPLSMLESRRRDLITSGTMVVTKAKRIVDRLDSEVPFGCRLEFIDALAALAAVFRHDMTRKVTGANVPLHHVLKCPSERTLLPSGTSSNEALHSEVKSWFRQTQQMHQSTLQLKLRVLTLGKVLPHYGALRYPTLSQMSSGLVLARIVTASVWTEDTWKQWCDGREKADLPLQRDRSEEVKKVSDWVSKKPAGRNGLKRKRTVFTVERSHKIRRQGVKRGAISMA